MLPLVLNRPLLGHGLTSFGDSNTQSDHVRLLLETGFIGWIPFICLAILVFRAVYRNYDVAKPSIEKNFVLAYLAFFVCVIIVGFAETNAFFQYYFWIPTGIALSFETGGRRYA